MGGRHRKNEQEGDDYQSRGEAQATMLAGWCRRAGIAWIAARSPNGAALAGGDFFARRHGLRRLADGTEMLAERPVNDQSPPDNVAFRDDPPMAAVGAVEAVVTQGEI